MKYTKTSDSDIPLSLANFRDKVEIVISEQSISQANSDFHSLKRTVTRYDDPFEPATDDEDWEVLLQSS